MATGEAVTTQSFIDRLYSVGSDALTGYIDIYRREQDVSAQERIIRAQGEQDRIYLATELQYRENARAVVVRNADAQGGALPSWAPVAGAAHGIALLALVDAAARATAPHDYSKI